MADFEPFADMLEGFAIVGDLQTAITEEVHERRLARIWNPPTQIERIGLDSPLKRHVKKLLDTLTPTERRILAQRFEEFDATEPQER